MQLNQKEVAAGLGGVAVTSFFVQIVSIPNCEADSRLKIDLTFLHSWRKIQIEELPVQHWRSLTCKLQKEVTACFGRLGGYFFLLLQMILMTCKNKPQIPTITSTSCSTSETLIGMALLSRRAINKKGGALRCLMCEGEHVRVNRQLYWHCLYYSIFCRISQRKISKTDVLFVSTSVLCPTKA